MKIFSCTACGQVVFFENVTCTRCGHALAYLPEHGIVSALDPDGDAMVALAPSAERARVRMCSNATLGACNWTVSASSSATLCRSCELDEVIPDLSDPVRKDQWIRLERAKRRLLYTLLDLGLPIEPRSRSPHGLAFAFRADTPDEKVMTGHADGLVTINVAEADDPFREKVRVDMGEAYRTLLGHFRHEIGHYYWARLIDGTPQIDPFRELFGDERADYQAALKRHYDEGPPADWPSRFVSAYASMHPWEDWAESFAHYLHVVDTLGTARSYGLVLRPKPVGGAPLAEVSARRLDRADFDEVIEAWVPLTLALNSINRGMGLPDLYPFVLSEVAISKLRRVHDVIDRSVRDSGATTSPSPGAA